MTPSLKFEETEFNGNIKIVTVTLGEQNMEVNQIYQSKSILISLIQLICPTK